LSSSERRLKRRSGDLGFIGFRKNREESEVENHVQEKSRLLEVPLEKSRLLERSP
jgi:hypothetical protein